MIIFPSHDDESIKFRKGVKADYTDYTKKELQPPYNKNDLPFILAKETLKVRRRCIRRVYEADFYQWIEDIEL